MDRSTRATAGEAIAWFHESQEAATDECIVWPYALSTHGYPVANRLGRILRLHRVACENQNGPPPDGLDAAHSCGNRACVNGRHLRWATRSENLADRRAHGTHQMGASGSRAKLTQIQVDEIRVALAAGECQAEIARRYEVCQQTISNIKYCRTFKLEVLW